LPNTRNQPLPRPESASGRGQSTIDRAVAIARRNLGLLLLCVLLVPAAALAFSLTQEKQYTASASLLFRDPAFDQKLFGSSLAEEGGDEQREAATNLRLLSLDEVAKRTAAALNSPNVKTGDVLASVEVTPEGESDIIGIEAVDPSPAFAAQMANTFAREYISFRRDADRAKVREAQTLVQRRLDGLSPDERTAAEGRELAKRSRELEILASLQTGKAELVQAASAPDSPSSPKTSRNLAVAIFLGLLLGVGLVLLREQLDRRLKDMGDAESVFDLPVLASIPESRSISKADRHAGVVAGSEAEAFLMLRANLRYFNVDRELRSILVTSAAPQDGKTTVSWNMAVAEARAGQRVLFIEADLRRPTLSEVLAVPSSRGLSLVLAGAVDAKDALQHAQGVDVLLAGPLPPNPAELLESQRMRQLVHWAEQNYDRVIIDTPPAAVVADAIPLMNRVSGVVVVVRLGRSRRDAAEHLREQLANIEAPVLGVVVNGAPARTSTYYYSSDERGLFAEPEAKPGRSAERLKTS
jgi:capsular exopolysaccharide synthesis family protein